LLRMKQRSAPPAPPASKIIVHPGRYEHFLKPFKYARVVSILSNPTKQTTILLSLTLD